MRRLGSGSAFQFAKYAIVGLSANALGYASYLLITWLGVGHKTAMTGIYVVTITMSYLGNKNITFSHQGEIGSTYFKYWIVYCGCYVFNLCTMYMAVDLAGLRHQYVQLALIFFDAPILFLLQKWWVFRGIRPSA